MVYFAFAGGLYLVMLGTWLETQNFKSMVIFKFLPITLGMTISLYAAQGIGWLQLG